MAVVFRPWALAFFADQGGGRRGRGCTYFTHNRSLETVDHRGGGGEALTGWRVFIRQFWCSTCSPWSKWKGACGAPLCVKCSASIRLKCVNKDDCGLDRPRFCGRGPFPAIDPGWIVACNHRSVIVFSLGPAFRIGSLLAGRTGSG